MKLKFFIFALLVFIFENPICIPKAQAGPDQSSPYTGSAVCKECHEKFHDLWSTSWHGKAARPYTSELAAKELTPQKENIVIGKYRYRADAGRVIETGPEGTRQFSIELVIGGKGTFNFLTTMPDGSVRSLPIGYDAGKKEWFDAVTLGESGTGRDDGSTDWKRKPSGFYTACPSCHVSQYSPSYEISKATYSAAWTEPGINCESCHGPAVEHVAIARKTPKGQPLPRLGLFRPKTMTAEQRNDLCNICHGHLKPLDASYKPGDRLFDHFELSTLEIDAFYPDGRGKGETFTLTNWLMSPCVKSAKLDCMHCHTSSGRYRFGKSEEANNACLPCHAERVKNATAHTRHPGSSPGNRCVSCHMAPTYFARMKQSDHSMLPPTPAATLALGSPNACNNCHKDKDAVWADKRVRAWFTDDYQAPVLRRARLIGEAIKGDWHNLPEMLKYIQGKDRSEVLAASFIRLMFMNSDPSILPVLLAAVKDPSPLVRSAAVQALGYRPSPVTRDALVHAARDDYRLVRISAAYGLTAPSLKKTGDSEEGVGRAIDEFLVSLMMHPDAWSSYDVAGNVYQSVGRFPEAEAAYQTALRIEPRAMSVMLGLSSLYLKKGESSKAEEILRVAIQTEPANIAANLTLGQLKYAGKNYTEAEKYFRNAFSSDPGSDQSAYKLCLITAKNRLPEAISWCEKAVELSPQSPRYAHSLALYQNQAGNQKMAIKTLERLIAGNSHYPDAYLLLADIYNKIGREKDAIAVYSRALAVEDLPQSYRNRIRAKQEALKQL